MQSICCKMKMGTKIHCAGRARTWVGRPTRSESPARKHPPPEVLSRMKLPADMRALGVGCRWRTEGSPPGGDARQVEAAQQGLYDELTTFPFTP